MRYKILLLALLIASSVSAQEKAIVKGITDGDTIRVNLNGKYKKIRLIGIDTPESRANDKAMRVSKRTKEDVEAIISNGKKATAFLRSILKNDDVVSLEYDTELYDKYDRTLAYVYLKDGRMLNDLIISSGYASLLTIPPNVRYKDRFLKSYKMAREKKIGLWSK